ncbi:MAG TPA: D-isomer specific 2-hydroxyacid dehydrogenase family protein [Acidimicrobiales bacterium]|jgi:phosphoglycerate dehydrogenase-like enzyme|nr:D-isomer specific 2-hydroxyacid dehydrogenase family protein [Acidimicrobiales bacterium]
MADRLPVAVLPAKDGGAPQPLAKAIEAGGGQVVAPEQAVALVWTAAGISAPSTAGALKETLSRYPALRWIQLPWAGVEQYARLGVFDHEHVWTCAKGIYAPPVAEHALALTLACLRHLKAYSRATSWSAHRGTMLFDRHVTIYGGGGIAKEIIRLLEPFRCSVTVVRKHPHPGPVPEVAWDQRRSTLADADVVILALALTEETANCLGRAEFELLPEHACVVNIARGRHIVTDDLVEALTSGQIAAAGLDVTEPEPLPDGHPLWALDNCLITPHTANTEEMAAPLLAARITENVRRFAAGVPLEGLVDPDLGY